MWWCQKCQPQTSSWFFWPQFAAHVENEIIVEEEEWDNEMTGASFKFGFFFFPCSNSCSNKQLLWMELQSGGLEVSCTAGRRKYRNCKQDTQSTIGSNTKLSSLFSPWRMGYFYYKKEKPGATCWTSLWITGFCEGWLLEVSWYNPC